MRWILENWVLGNGSSLCLIGPSQNGACLEARKSGSCMRPCRGTEFNTSHVGRHLGVSRTPHGTRCFEAHEARLRWHSRVRSPARVHIRSLRDQRSGVLAAGYHSSCYPLAGRSFDSRPPLPSSEASRYSRFMARRLDLRSTYKGPPPVHEIAVMAP